MQDDSEVLIWYKGEPHVGRVIRSEPELDSVLISLELKSGARIQTVRKLDEVVQSGEEIEFKEMTEDCASSNNPFSQPVPVPRPRQEEQPSSVFIPPHISQSAPGQHCPISPVSPFPSPGSLPPSLLQPLSPCRHTHTTLSEEQMPLSPPSSLSSSLSGMDSSGGQISPRGKCRRIYGIENKHMWCTQCRWKKACTRFKATSCSTTGSQPEPSL